MLFQSHNTIANPHRDLSHLQSEPVSKWAQWGTVRCPQSSSSSQSKKRDTQAMVLPCVFQFKGPQKLQPWMSTNGLELKRSFFSLLSLLQADVGRTYLWIHKDPRPKKRVKDESLLAGAPDLAQNKGLRWRQRPFPATEALEAKGSPWDDHRNTSTIGRLGPAGGGHKEPSATERWFKKESKIIIHVSASSKSLQSKFQQKVGEQEAGKGLRGPNAVPPTSVSIHGDEIKKLRNRFHRGKQMNFEWRFERWGKWLHADVLGGTGGNKGDWVGAAEDDRANLCPLKKNAY